MISARPISHEIPNTIQQTPGENRIGIVKSGERKTKPENVVTNLSGVHFSTSRLVINEEMAQRIPGSHHRVFFSCFFLLPDPETVFSGRLMAKSFSLFALLIDHSQNSQLPLLLVSSTQLGRGITSLGEILFEGSTLEEVFMLQYFFLRGFWN